MVMAGNLLQDFWFHIRAPVLVPLLQMVANIGLAMVVMMVVDRAYMFSVVVLVKLFGKTPHQCYKFKPLQGPDVDLPTSLYPKVLLQIPMYNEREVYKLSIGAACRISWPSSRLIVQVLDDSTDTSIKDLVQLECQRWANDGLNIKYEVRKNRVGYKAGALQNGMNCSYVKECEFVAIFDADFQPDSDFLERTIPFFMYNSKIALVQAQWTFVNAKECLMTQMQEMTLRYHFLVEQEMGSSLHAFFGFNGTAGVWRISAIEEAGGWKDRTTVEDLDLSMRVGLFGWKFVYLNDLEVKSELPNTFNTFRHQQHRWSSGPASLFIKILPEIIYNKKIGLWRKVHLLYAFFVVRKFIVPMASFGFFCLVIPSTVLFPEVRLPKWGVIYMPSLLTIINAMCNLRSLHFLLFSTFFETVMALHRTKATIIGLFGLAGANKWVVTKKLGDTMKSSPEVLRSKGRINIRERVYPHELLVGIYIFFCAIYELKFGRFQFSAFLLMQATSFFVMGFGYIGILVHTT